MKNGLDKNAGHIIDFYGSRGQGGEGTNKTPRSKIVQKLCCKPLEQLAIRTDISATQTRKQTSQRKRKKVSAHKIWAFELKWGRSYIT